MAYTVKLILELPSALADAVKTYLDAQSPTTIHTITLTKVGQFIACLIVFE